MALLLYLLTAATLLGVVHRWVRNLSVSAAFVILLLPFCLTGRALLTGGVYAPIDNAYASEPLRPLREVSGVRQEFNGILTDVASQMIPWRKAVQWSLQHREWPLLNPFILSGDVLAASGQPAAYSPFTLLAILLPAAPSFTYTAAITFFLAGLGAFLFARELGISEPAAIVASAGWMYSTAISFFVLWPVGFCWSILPLVLLGARRVVTEQSWSAAMLMMISLTVMLLGGHPETVLHVVFVGVVYAFVQLTHRRTAYARALGLAASAGVLALLLCAIYLLPLLQAVEQTEEHVSRNAIFANQTRGKPAGITLARIATDVFPFLHGRQWRLPLLNDIPIDSAAVGSIVLALAIYAAWRVRSRETWFFLGLTVFGLLMRGDWPPLTRTMQKLPLFDIALNERFSFAAAFALAVLAGIGVEELRKRGSDSAAAITLAVTLVVLAAGTLVIEHAQLVRPNAERWGESKIAADLGMLGIATLILAFRIRTALALPLLLGCILIQRTQSESGVYPVYPPSAAYPPVPVFKHLDRTRGPFRITGSHVTFIPGMSALYELEDVRGYQAMTNRRYFETYPLWCRSVPVWFNRVEYLSRPFLSFLNVRYAVVWPGYPTPEGWRVLATESGTPLLENTRVIERAFVPRRVRLGTPKTETIAEMAAETDFRERAWILASDEPHERTNGPGRLVTAHTGTDYLIAADMENDGWIVISTVAWEGWRAYIDGRRVRIQIANHAFLGVFVPKGRHRVTLTYWPESFVIGRAISLATIAGLALAAVVRQRRRRRS